MAQLIPQMAAQLAAAERLAKRGALVRNARSIEALGRVDVLVTIADHGCGMDGDFIRNRLFQPFASTKSGGFGIGSFEARSLIVAMGGRLSVDSRPGQGTTFTITLPIRAFDPR